MSSSSSDRHRSLYKLRTPPWKEAARARCLQRLKGSRSLLVERFRGLLLGESDAEIDAFLAILEQTKLELRREEEREVLEQYIAAYCEEEEEEVVVCPVCQKDALRQNPSAISCCSCGLRIDVQGLTLSQLKSALSRGLREHETCLHPPAFSLVAISPQVNNLTITCAACEFMYIVI